ncbi:nuclear transport factor 2 family protein [Streptomyces luteireticuli]|uniref:SnoaL-like domain-containing protein n=1 Tax=Streptomyces luteireticuli TaxID=173858 RepID=A0ABN0YXQ3_9ACTN
MPGLQRHPNIELAIAYHRAVARGATGTELARFFHPDAVQREFPNTLVPDGAVRDLSAILAAAERGRKVIAEQDFEVLDAVAAGDRTALELRWRGTLAVPLGDLPAGHRMSARIAVFLTFRDGRIVTQHNYDCYEG